MAGKFQVYMPSLEVSESQVEFDDDDEDDEAESREMIALLTKLTKAKNALDDSKKRKHTQQVTSEAQARYEAETQEDIKKFSEKHTYVKSKLVERSKKLLVLIATTQKKVKSTLELHSAIKNGIHKKDYDDISSNMNKLILDLTNSEKKLKLAAQEEYREVTSVVSKKYGELEIYVKKLQSAPIKDDKIIMLMKTLISDWRD